MPAPLHLGLFSINSGACARPETASRVARLAEEAGFESLWAGEHVVLPDPRVPPAPMNPEDPILDPLVALSFLAGQTRTIRLGTGIIILPQRNPLVLAKEVATLDVLSGGRLILGIGVGYLEPELSAIGVSLRERGARTDEYLAAMRSVWYDARPHFEGRFARFSGIQASPRPGRLPIVFGGRAPAALRRAVSQGTGWYGWGMDVEETARYLAELRRIEETAGRPAQLGRLEISITPEVTPDRETAQRFADLGVDRLVLRPERDADEASVVGYVTEVARTLIA